MPCVTHNAIFIGHPLLTASDDTPRSEIRKIMRLEGPRQRAGNILSYSSLYNLKPYRPGKRAPDSAREFTLGIHMHTTLLAAFFALSRTPLSMCSAGILVFLMALWATKADIARVRGLDKIVALSNLFFAIPLAVFGALHLS